MSRRQKVLYYEKQMQKFAENAANAAISRDNDDHMIREILEKARYSNHEITSQELNLVKRHLKLLKRKNKNVTKILNSLK